MGLLYSNYECKPVTNNSLKINAVSGTLTKTYKDSYFVRFKQESVVEHFYFRDDKPSKIVKRSYEFFRDYDEKYDDYYYNLKEVVILQTMLCGEEQFLCEIIDKDKYDEMFEKALERGK